MAHNKTTLTMLLLVSIPLVGSNLPSVSSSPRPLLNSTAVQKDREKQKDKEQTSGADAERTAGRRSLRRGEAGEALIHLEEALKLYRQATDKSGEAATLDLLGELYEQQGRYDLALEHFQKAYAIYTGSKEDKYNASLMLAKIGNMNYQQDKFKEARDAYNLIKVDKPDTGSSGKAKRWGGFSANLGMPGANSKVDVPAAAVGSLLATKQLFDFYRQTIIYAGRETGMGRVDYRSDELESAKKHFENALSATKGDLPGIGNLGQTRRFRIAARTGLGDVKLKQGDTKKAAEIYENAVEEATKEKRKDLMWPAQRGLGRSLWLQAKAEMDVKKREKYQADAVDAYDAALKNIEELRAGSLRADEARTSFLATTKDVFDEAASILAEMALMSPQPNACGGTKGPVIACAAKAFNVVERGRARSLLDLLGETGTSIREGVPTELFEKKQKNLDLQAEVAQSILGVTLSDKQSQSVEALDNEADRLQVEEVKIENEIRINSQQRYKDLTSPQPLTLEQVQQQVLDDGTALLEYSLGLEASYLWAVTKGEVRIFKLPARDEINKQADELRQQILPRNEGRSILELTPKNRQRAIREVSQYTSVSASAFVMASHKLYLSILKPAIAVVGERRLLIVPDGGLSFVPFEALVNAPGGDDYAALPYLAKTREIVYAPSASVISALRQQASGNSPTALGAILLIADPIFDIDDERASNLPVGSAATAAVQRLFVTSAVADIEGVGKELPANFTLRRLGFTLNEADQIEQTAMKAGLRVEKWLNLDASEAKAKGDLRPYTILHIATHGILDPVHPQFSSVVFSLVGNNEGQDGFLRTNEIFNLRLGSPLVMLSACESGLGKEKSGEGVMGMTRAFMYAGAPMVGVTLWSVDDQATSDLMSDFYALRLAKDGAKPVAAMRAARQKMIASGGKYSAPFYWAPFVLIGDWR